MSLSYPKRIFLTALVMLISLILIIAALWFPPVDREIEDRSPGTVDDIYAALERMDQAKAKLKERPAEPNPDDMFDTNLLKDLIRENEPHADAQRRWQSDYNQLLNRLVDSRLPPLSPTEREYQRRLQAALYMGRMGAVEIL